nr:hypothetical protein [Burkholderia pyrrocinia]
MYAHDSTTRSFAQCQYAGEDVQLIEPVLFVLRPTVKTNFPNVPSVGQKLLEELQLTFPLMDDLRMKSQRCPDS